jgi:hypothetical protein
MADGYRGKHVYARISIVPKALVQVCVCSFILVGLVGKAIDECEDLSYQQTRTELN